MKKKNIAYKIIFFPVMLLVLAVLAAFILFQMRAVHGVDMPLTEIDSALDAASDRASLTTGSPLLLKRNFTMLSTGYDEVLYLVSDEFLSVNEILIVKSQNADQLDQAYALMQDRRTRQMNSFESYGTNQYELAENAVVYKNDLYAFYVCGEHAAETAELIKERIER